jgi:hypothetical protein
MKIMKQKHTVSAAAVVAVAFASLASSAQTTTTTTIQIARAAGPLSVSGVQVVGGFIQVVSTGTPVAATAKSTRKLVGVALAIGKVNSYTATFDGMSSSVVSGVSIDAALPVVASTGVSSGKATPVVVSFQRTGSTSDDWRSWIAGASAAKGLAVNAQYVAAGIPTIAVRSYVLSGCVPTSYDSSANPDGTYQETFATLCNALSVSGPLAPLVADMYASSNFTSATVTSPLRTLGYGRGLIVRYVLANGTETLSLFIQ